MAGEQRWWNSFLPSQSSSLGLIPLSCLNRWSLKKIKKNRAGIYRRLESAASFALQKRWSQLLSRVRNNTFHVSWVSAWLSSLQPPVRLLRYVAMHAHAKQTPANLRGEKNSIGLHARPKNIKKKRNNKKKAVSLNYVTKLTSNTRAHTHSAHTGVTWETPQIAGTLVWLFILWVSVLKIVSDLNIWI